MFTQTDLIVNFTDGSQMFFADVHTDNHYRIEDGLLTFESADGEQIHYLPAINVRNFFTVEVDKHD